MAGPASRESIKLNYTLHCMGCHKSDGSGQGHIVPSFRGNIGRFLSTPGGRDYLVRVPGTAQSLLSDRETAELLNWVVREFDAEHVPDDFRPYTAAEVGRLRAVPLPAPAAERKRLIQASLEALPPASR